MNLLTPVVRPQAGRRDLGPDLVGASQQRRVYRQGVYNEGCHCLTGLNLGGEGREGYDASAGRRAQPCGFDYLNGCSGNYSPLTGTWNS